MSIRIAIVASLIVVVILGVAFSMRRLDSEEAQFKPLAQQLPTELAAAKREGLALTADDLRNQRPVPDGDNAARLYEAIHARLALLSAQVQAEEKQVDKLARSKRREDRILAGKFIARRGSEMALAEQAVRRPRCAFNRAWELGPAVPLPEYTSMRQVARLFAAQAILKSESGDLDGAFKAIALGAKVGKHAGDDPIAIALLVNLAINETMDRAFQDVVFRNMDNPSTVKQGRGLAEFASLQPLAHSFRGEVLMSRVAVETYRHEQTEMEPAMNFLSGKSATLRKLLCDASETRIIQYWRSCFRALKDHPTDVATQAAKIKSLGDQLVAHAKEPTYIVPSILMTIYTDLAQKFARGKEEQRLRRTLILLIEHLQNSGGWPASLSELVEAPQADIFTGRPPVYRKINSGFILYSVGANLKDDGGISGEATGYGPLDVVVRFPL